MRTKDKLKIAALKSKLKILMDAYRQARTRVLSIQLKRLYFSAKISECEGNMKESWKTINELLNKDQNLATLIVLRILSIPL